MTVPEIIAVLQAYQSGKTIQACSLQTETPIWNTSDKDRAPSWDFSLYKYRVAPEPRTFWVVVDVDTPIHTFFLEEGAKAYVKLRAKHGDPTLKIVECQEVIEDN